MTVIANALVGLHFALFACGADEDQSATLKVAQGRIERIGAKEIVVSLQATNTLTKTLTMELAPTSRLLLATTVERAGKSIVTQHAAEVADLKARQPISVIYAENGSLKTVLTAIVQPLRAEPASKSGTESAKLPPGIPAKVGTVLKYVDDHDTAPKDYEGGRTFSNLGRDGEESLPRKNAKGKAIRYREWDVNPHIPGKNRGAERLITGSDGSAYYTANHYRTFKKIR